MALQCFGRDALFELHLPEIDQRHFTYLSLIVDRLSIALRDLEDERIVGRYHYPEDDSPLDVGQYGFSLHPYDEGMTLAVKRLTPGQRAMLAMILRQYCHAFNERFPDVTLFQYALRQFPSEGLREISMQAVPVLMQLADDIGEDIPVNKELDMLRQAGFVDPVLDTRSQCILRYGTSNDWPLAAYLRLVNLHLRNILDVEHRLPATEFLDFIFNDSLSEEIIRRNLSMDTGLEITLAASLRCFRRQVPRSLARAFCMSSALTLPLLKDILNSPDKSLDEILSGTPLASCNQQSVDQFMAGAASYVSGYREDFPREIVDFSDRAGMFAVVKEEIPRLREDITLAVKGLTEHESRELFRGVILYWSVALTLLRRHAETVTNDVDRNGYELLCNFIAVGTGDLIERFNLIDWQEKAEESIEEEPADKTMLN